MDQNRKPGVPPTKDISDLKARLGLKRPDGAAPAPVGPGPGSGPAAAGRPQPGGFPQQAGRPAPAPMPGHQAAPAAQAQPPAGMNPYAKMKAPTGGFDLRSADDGVPAASDSETIQVQVLGLTIGGPIHRGNNLELTWGTQPGQKYAVDTTANLNPPIQWQPIVTNTATGSSLSYTNNTTGTAQEFFRLRLVP